MNDDVTLAVLGVGNIGMVHLQSALNMEGVTVTSVADTVERNRNLARKWGVPTAYEDYRTLLREESPDVAVIAMPPFLHAPAVELAAEQGTDLFVEKPFARTVDEAEEMVANADRGDIALGVDHTLRYMPAVQQMKVDFDDGAVGHAPFAMLSRVNSGPFSRPPVTEPLSEWQLDPDATGGGVLLDLGLHLFDLVEWYFGDVEVIGAETSRQLDLPFEDAATVVLRSTETNTAITVHCGSYQWEELPKVNSVFRIEGVAGTLDTRSYEPGDFYTNAAQSAARNVWKRVRGETPDRFAPTYYLQAHYRALQAFVDAVGSGEDPPVRGVDGLRTLELAERAYELADDVEIEEVSPTL